MERPSRLPLYIGIALLVCGWAVIAIAWWQAGRQDLETGQLPYVISGGFGGFGLLLMGVISIIADVVRQAESKLRASADELHERMHELAEAFVLEQAAPARASRTSRSQNAAKPRAASRSRRPHQG